MSLTSDWPVSYAFIDAVWTADSAFFEWTGWRGCETRKVVLAISAVPDRGYSNLPISRLPKGAAPCSAERQAPGEVREGQRGLLAHSSRDRLPAGRQPWRAVRSPSAHKRLGGGLACPAEKGARNPTFSIGQPRSWGIYALACVSWAFRNFRQPFFGHVSDVPWECPVGSPWSCSRLS